MDQKKNKYAKIIRSTDERIINLFKGMSVVDEKGHCHSVPIIFGINERFNAHLVAAPQIHLPMSSIYNYNIDIDWPTFSNTSRRGGDPLPLAIYYSYNIYSLYQEDRNQLIEQSLLKFDPQARINQKDGWETVVILKSISTNEGAPAADKAMQDRALFKATEEIPEVDVQCPLRINKCRFDLKAVAFHNRVADVH